MTRNKPKLSACPFCGGEAELQTGQTCGATLKTQYLVRCNQCGTTSGWWNLESEAAWAWNRRTCNCEKMDKQAIEETVRGAAVDLITDTMTGKYDGWDDGALIEEYYERMLQAIRYQMATPVEQGDAE